MPSRARLTRVKGKRQEHRTGSQGRIPIRTSPPKQQAGSRRSVRLKNKAPVSDDVHPIPPVPVSQPSRLKRKRPQTLEGDADKTEGVRPRKQSPRLPSPMYQLTADNLRILNGDMNSPANDGSTLKRSSSRRSMTATASDIETRRSQRSSNTTAFYRYERLADADIYIHADIPDDIQVVIDSVVGIEISSDRLPRLGNITKTFHEACKEKVRDATGEDDFVQILYKALDSMNLDNILFRANADWREELKPIMQQSNLDLSFLESSNAPHQQQEANDTLVPPPPKRQQQSGQMGIAPQSSIVAASDSPPSDPPAQSGLVRSPTPCPLPKKAKGSTLKTPRPDISIGIKETALISALCAISPQNLNNTGAKRFLKRLNNTLLPCEQGGTTEPLLITGPTQPPSELIFPFAVVEGKAYSTGKQVFEAQNQAAVSGASGLKIQLSLNELVKRSTRSIGNTHPQSDNPPPLFFSICTEGPYHELWVHYTHVEDNVRKFKMKLLKICNGMLLESVGDFMAAADNVLRWGAGKFLDSVVERLGIVARRAGI